MEINTECAFCSLQAVEREQVDSIQPKLQHVNAVGQGLIQSAAKHTDTQGLEHDLETTNLQWNSLNKRVTRTSEAYPSVSSKCEILLLKLYCELAAHSTATQFELKKVPL